MRWRKWPLRGVCKHQPVSAQEYARCYGIDVDACRAHSVGFAPTIAATSPDFVAAVHLASRRNETWRWRPISPSCCAASHVSDGLHRWPSTDGGVVKVPVRMRSNCSKPHIILANAEASATRPENRRAPNAEVGDVLVGFRLISQVGSRVAECFWPNKARVSPTACGSRCPPICRGRSQTLAQLQHTDVVHLFREERAVPDRTHLFGGEHEKTLVDVLHRLKTDSMPASASTSSAR